jgi:hypothetical protein
MKRSEARANIRLGSLMFVVALLMLAASVLWAVIYSGFTR